MTQIIFADKKSYDDFGLVIESFNIQPPSKKKIKQSVPFMNGSYDFSMVGSNGEIVYTERTIKVNFWFSEINRGLLYNKYSQALEWLLGAGQSELIFTDMPDTYFLAEVEEAPDFGEVVARLGRFQITFIAEPFRYGVDYEGQKLWDPFNFETDYMQDTEFDVIGSETVTIYNPGRPVIPTINVNAAMFATLNNYTVALQQGDNIDRNFMLLPGANVIDIIGTGHIKFLFRKVLL
ncbi:phage tail family protein [Caldicoprobacter algeriensis]|uniref:distal tail protein Dit n=1 Tax=Caldicoprobacter algeriensis TaxID=699281 RepID=UPI0020795B45|nr:distal tail protein Dit [Caldicoprobacter algeriensis]MCM8900622.1 phage tail family protein [Caldicoprobacter algeriensis]